MCVLVCTLFSSEVERSISIVHNIFNWRTSGQKPIHEVRESDVPPPSFTNFGSGTEIKRVFKTMTIGR